ncbi:hypothetical protein [Flaviaesturariibacter terrae]
MFKVTIQFQTPQDFSRFRSMVSGQVTTINIGNLSITCNCTPELLAHAMNDFGGVVLQEWPAD